MAIYTFYFCRDDNIAPSFEARELPSDTAAAELARALLSQHLSCSHVRAHDGERLVSEARRQPADQPSEAREVSAIRILGDQAADLDAAVIATDWTGVVRYWSPAATRLYHWRAEEAVGRNIIELTPALQSRSEARSIMDALQKGRSWEGEIVLRKRDGTPFKAFVADMPIGRPEVGGLIVGVSMAAGRRKEAVRQIRPLFDSLQAQLGQSA